MRLTANMKIVLLGVLRDMEAIRKIPDHWPDGTDRFYAGRMRERKQLLPKVGVPYRLSEWLGCPLTPADSASFSRTLATMERDGLIIRTSYWSTGRTTHLRLTVDGERLASRLTGQELPQ